MHTAALCANKSSNSFRSNWITQTCISSHLWYSHILQLFACFFRWQSYPMIRIDVVCIDIWNKLSFALTSWTNYLTKWIWSAAVGKADNEDLCQGRNITSGLNLFSKSTFTIFTWLSEFAESELRALSIWTPRYHAYSDNSKTFGESRILPYHQSLRFFLRSRRIIKLKKPRHYFYRWNLEISLRNLEITSWNLEI